MSVFQVFTHPDPTSEAGVPVFIKEKFSWGAALLPPVWALVYGLWLEAVLWVLGVLVLRLLSFGIGEEAASWLYVLFAIFIGFEAANIRAAGLRRKGYHGEGDVVASSDDVAEMLWLKSGTAQ